MEHEDDGVVGACRMAKLVKKTGIIWRPLEESIQSRLNL